MRERVGCRDWSGGERIFFTDWENIIKKLLIIGICIGLIEIFFGVGFNSNGIIMLGIVLVVFSLIVGFVLGNGGVFDYE